MSVPIDTLWRSFFYGPNSHTLCHVIAELNDQLMHICQTYCLLTNSDRDESYLNRIDEMDLSILLKVPSYRFETVFKNSRDRNIGLTFSQAIFRYYQDSRKLSKLEIDELKKAINEARQYEMLATILLNGRNSNAHTHFEVNDIGNALIIGGAILRIFEIFELNSISDLEKGGLIEVAEKIIVEARLGDEIETTQNEFETETTDDELQQTQHLEEDDSAENIEEIFIDEDTVDLYTVKNTEERRRQMLLRLRTLILDANFERSTSIISRSSVREIMSLGITQADDLKRVFSIQQLKERDLKSVDEQIDLIKKSFEMAMK